jgi:tol-pal system protein YbgF
MKTSAFFILTVSATVFAACVQAAPPPPVLDSSVYRSNESSYTSTIPNSSNNYSAPNVQVADNVGRLQNEVNQLKAKVEEMRQRQETINLAVDKKLANLSSSAGMYGSNPTGIPTNIPMSMQSTTGKPSTGQSEKQMYDAAYLDYQNRNFDAAMNEFTALITAYPSGSYADNAQYWIGKTLVRKGDKSGALLAFNQVVQNYPNGNKVPDAMLEIATILISQNEKTKAKEYLDYLMTTYPGTSIASLAASTKNQAKL